MALSKALDTDSGAVAEYWRLSSMGIDFTHSALWYVMSGYISASIRQAGKTAVSEQRFRVEFPKDTDPWEMATAEFIYSDAKSRDVFIGALDV